MLQHRRDSDDTIDSRSVDTSKPLKDDHFECHQHFIGAMLAKDVGKSVKPNEFVIYYQLPDVNGPLPFKLRLFLAYKSNQTKVSIISDNINPIYRWEYHYNQLNSSRKCSIFL